MTLEEFECGVRQQIQARKPAKQPDDRAIQTAVTFYKELGAIRADTIPQCAALAIVIARAYPQGQTDPGLHEATPPRELPVIDRVSAIQALIVQGREERWGFSCCTVLDSRSGTTVLHQPKFR